MYGLIYGWVKLPEHVLLLFLIFPISHFPKTIKNTYVRILETEKSWLTEEHKNRLKVTGIESFKNKYWFHVLSLKMLIQQTFIRPSEYDLERPWLTLSCDIITSLTSEKINVMDLLGNVSKISVWPGKLWHSTCICYCRNLTLLRFFDWLRRKPFESKNFPLFHLEALWLAEKEAIW